MAIKGQNWFYEFWELSVKGQNQFLDVWDQLAKGCPYTPILTHWFQVFKKRVNCPTQHWLLLVRGGY